jgi:ribosome maturation factor RimP
MTAKELPRELREELHSVAEAAQCELVHIELKGPFLRLILDRPEGVTVDDCASVSREASALLDAWDWGTGRYTLEVSSPGLDRPLYKSEDYERFVGRLARITFIDEESGARQTIVARLEEYLDSGKEGDAIRVSEGESSFVISLQRIQKARLEIET